MSADALPLTLLIIFAEFTIGGLWVLWLADLRGAAAASLLKVGAGAGFRPGAPHPPRRRSRARRRVDGDDPGSLVPGDAPPAGAAAAGGDVLPPTGAGVPSAAPYPLARPAAGQHHDVRGRAHRGEPVLLDAGRRRPGLPGRPLLHGFRLQRRPGDAIGHGAAVHCDGPRPGGRGAGQGTLVRDGGPHLMGPSKEETIWPAREPSCSRRWRA